MKKNLMMRAASVLLVAVMLTTCAISGTFAKYVTAADTSDTARVAKFGVRVSASANLFDTNYATNLDPAAKDKVGNDITVVVNSTQNVVAPGTANVGNMTFTLTGIPEVAVNVNIDINDAEMKDVFLAVGTDYLDWTTGNSTTDTFENNTVYNPLVFTLKDGHDNVLQSGTLKDIDNYLTNTLSGNYAAGTDLSTIVAGNDGTYVLSWAWAFNNGKDKQDTLLGNIAANAAVFGAGLTEEVDYNLSVNVPFSITVTQID